MQGSFLFVIVIVQRTTTSPRYKSAKPLPRVSHYFSIYPDLLQNAILPTRFIKIHPVVFVQTNKQKTINEQTVGRKRSILAGGNCC